MISCTSERYRRAYGWQRDGGMADYMIAEEKDLIALPDELSSPTVPRLRADSEQYTKHWKRSGSTAITPFSSPDLDR